MVFSLVFSFLQVGLLINTILTLLPKNIQANFTQLIQFAFIKDPASFVWLVLPIGFLIVLGRLVSDRAEV
jgi:hypothetical protein